MPKLPEPESLPDITGTTVTPASPLSMVRRGRYLWVLLALLMSATVFEGYDVTIFHLCTPDIARSFHLDDRLIGLMASVVRFGQMLAFFVVMLADRIGRKRLCGGSRQKLGLKLLRETATGAVGAWPSRHSAKRAELIKNVKRT